MKGMWRRIGWLVGALLLSFGILWLILRFQYFLEKCSIFEVLLDKEHLFHLSLAIIALPISIALWCFRTYDNKMSSFLQASSHLGGGNSEKRMAIIQLMLLKNKEQVFTQEIDRLTQGISLEGEEKRGAIKRLNLSNLDLREINFSNSNLNHVDLSGSELQNANFSNAILIHSIVLGANLQGVDLSRAELKINNLSGANLQGVNLCGAILIKTNSLAEAELTGAVYDDETQFPPELDSREDRDRRGMIYKP